MVENGSYFRLSGMDMGYTFSLSGIFKQVRIFVSCYNVFSISRYSGKSPHLVGNVNSYGIDYGLCPGPVTILTGIQLDL